MQFHDADMPSDV